MKHEPNNSTVNKPQCCINRPSFRSRPRSRPRYFPANPRRRRAIAVLNPHLSDMPGRRFVELAISGRSCKFSISSVQLQYRVGGVTTLAQETRSISNCQESSIMLARTVSFVMFVILPLACSMLVAGARASDDWPCFRGPTGMGVAADDPRLAERWSKTEHVRWVTEVPGWGWSCPIVSGGKVFLTAVVNEKEYEKPQKGLYNGTGRAEPPEGDAPLDGVLPGSRLGQDSSGSTRRTRAGRRSPATRRTPMPPKRP